MAAAVAALAPAAGARARAGAAAPLRSAAAMRPAAQAGGSTNWSLKKTIKDKSLGDLSSNISEGVRFGGFTPANERFVARMSMLGMAAAVVGEVVTGKGALGQLGLETGIPLIELEDALAAQIGVFFLLAAAGFQTQGKFISDVGSLAFMKPGSWRDAWGLNPEGEPLFGYTANNELFIGRLAALGFIGTAVVEGLTGAGPLAQIGFETGASVGFEEELLGASVLFFLWSAVFPSIIPAKLGGPDAPPLNAKAAAKGGKKAAKAAGAKKAFGLF